MASSLIVGSATRGGRAGSGSGSSGRGDLGRGHDVATGGGVALSGLGHPGPDGSLASLVGRHLVRLQAPTGTRTHAPATDRGWHEPTSSRRSPFASTGRWREHRDGGVARGGAVAMIRRVAKTGSQGSRSSARTWRGRKTAMGRRSNVATRRTPEPLGGGHEQGVGQPRPVLRRLAEQLRGPGQVRLGRGDEADGAVGQGWPGRPGSRPARARAGAAGRARPGSGRPSRRGSSARANQATAASWLRSARSAAATITEPSSRIATPAAVSERAERRPASRRAMRRPSRDRRPWPLSPMPDEAERRRVRRARPARPRRPRR